MTRLIQLNKGNLRRVALAEEPNLRVLDSCTSVYELAHVAMAAGMKLSDVAHQRARNETIPYDPIYRGESDWKLLPAMDHPEESARCLISGTGLTHLGSARNRQSMHATKEEDLTDSMRMFRGESKADVPPPGASVFLLNGSTKVQGTCYGRTENRSTFRATPKMVEKRQRSLEYTSLDQIANPIGWGSRQGTNFRTTNSKKEII